ncbi:hypothetical protein JKP88DRAFT_301186, partial [Tribonema minus]
CTPLPQELDLSGCGSLEGFSRVSAPHLLTLTLGHCRKLELLDMGAPRLRSLVAPHCPLLGPWPLAAGNMAPLRLAALTGCKSLPSGFLACLVESCKGLKRLEVFGAGEALPGKLHWAWGHRDATLKTQAPLKSLEKLRPGLVVIRTKSQHWAAQHGSG